MKNCISCWQNSEDRCRVLTIGSVSNLAHTQLSKLARWHSLCKLAIATPMTYGMKIILPLEKVWMTPHPWCTARKVSLWWYGCADTDIRHERFPFLSNGMLAWCTASVKLNFCFLFTFFTLKINKSFLVIMYIASLLTESCNLKPATWKRSELQSNEWNSGSFLTHDSRWRL